MTKKKDYVELVRELCSLEYLPRQAGSKKRTCKYDHCVWRSPMQPGVCLQPCCMRVKIDKKMGDKHGRGKV